MPGEGVELFVERGSAEAGETGIVGAGAIEDPAVEADFADEGVRVGVERVEKGVAPVGGGVADVPRVEAVGRKEAKLRVEGCELRVGVRAEGGDVGPVLFAGAVDDAGVDGELSEVGEDAVAVGREPGVLEVVVGVEEGSHERSPRNSAKEFGLFAGFGVVREEVSLGEGAKGSLDGGEAVAAGGGEGAREAEVFEGVEGGRENFGGGEVAVKIGEQGDEAQDDRGIGADPEVTVAVAKFGHEPDAGGAAGDAVGRRAKFDGKFWAEAGAVDDEGEPFLGVVEVEEGVEEVLLVRGQFHVKRKTDE